MRYWRLKESDRVIAVDVLMSYRWEEITLEEFDLAREREILFLETGV